MIFQPDRPFPVRTLPFFYGGVILLGSILGQVMSAPGQTIGVSVFTDHLIAATGLSRLTLSTAYMIGTAGGSFLLPIAGRYYDVLGGRRTVILASIGLGCALLYLSQVDILAGWLARPAPELYSQIAFAVLLLGFLSVRFTGQGSLALFSRNVLMEWFESRRGLANGISGTFAALGFSAAPLAFSALIEVGGWRNAWVMLAAMAGLVFPLLAYVLLRDKPEDHGLKPDGDLPPPPVKDASELSHPAHDYDLPAARRTYEFWIFSLGLSIFALYMTAMTFHIFSIFAAAGLDRDAAIGIFLPGAVISVVFNLIGGWLSDRMRLRYFLVVHFAGQILSGLGLLWLGRPGAILAIVLGNGIATGSFWLLTTVSWPRLFGRAHLGAISGAGMFWNVLFSAFGPVLFALSEEYAGGYEPAILACILAMGGFALAALRIRH